ncbi:conserved Plasmodium protein, unknown function [Plasmodium berghei]|uniref:Uncharacterized protein n=1 Tax=Plasmodium berghei TaxID=5821 RepID=A0A1D3S7D3_PLABE|nr:conserved Plasmodium protein, unknown function [Plasmodium berghei]
MYKLYDAFFFLHINRKISNVKNVIIHTRGIKISKKLYSEFFIFNFENVENLKKIKETSPTITTNYLPPNGDENKKDEKKFLYENILDKSRLKKTRKILSLVKNKLINYDQIYLNRYFFIFYKNIDCLLDFEIINIVYLAVKYKKYHLLRNIDDNNNNVNYGVTTNNNSNNITHHSDTLNSGNVEDISDHIITQRNEINQESIIYSDIRDSDFLGDNTFGKEQKDNTHNMVNNRINTELDKPPKLMKQNNVKQKSIDYVQIFLYKFIKLLREKKKKINVTIFDLYKLTYSINYYKMCVVQKKILNKNNKGNVNLDISYIITYLCVFLKNEIYNIHENNSKNQIKNEKDLNNLLNILIMGQNNLNVYFFNLFYDYLFMILKKNTYPLSIKNICLLLQINKFERTQYDPFFFFLLFNNQKNRKNEDINKYDQKISVDIITKTPFTLKDINYLFFYQLKNNVIYNNSSFNIYLINTLLKSEINSFEFIQNVELFSLMLLHYDYSNFYFNEIYEKYVELIYKMQLYNREMPRHVINNDEINRCHYKFENKNEKTNVYLNIKFISTFSLALYIIRNNLRINEEFYLYIFYLFNNYSHLLTPYEYVIFLNFIYYSNLKNEQYFRKNSLYKNTSKFFINSGTNDMEYLPIDDNIFFLCVYKKIQRIYSYNNDVDLKKYSNIHNYTNLNSKMCNIMPINIMNNTENKSIMKESTYSNGLPKFLKTENEIYNNNMGNDKLIEDKSNIEKNFEKKKIYKNDIIMKLEEQNKNDITIINVKNKSYFMHILDILLLLKNNNYDNKFSDYLFNFFDKNVWKYNINIFDIDKILFSYTQLNIQRNSINLYLLNFIEIVKKNIICNDNIEKETYVFSSMCNILLSFSELNIRDIIDLSIFEKHILIKIDKININSILILIQHFVLREEKKENVSIIIFLLLKYIKKKYGINKNNTNTNEDGDIDKNLVSSLNELKKKNDKNYDFIKNYLDENKHIYVPNKTNQQNSNYIDKNKLQNISIRNKNYNLLFKKKNEDDNYEFLLIRFIFIYIFTHSNLLHDNFNYYYMHGEIYEQNYYKNMLNNFNKIILHLKTNFLDVLNIKEYENSQTDELNNPHYDYHQIDEIKKQNLYPYDTKKCDNITGEINMSLSVNNIISEYKHTETLSNISHSIEKNIENKYNILSKQKFSLLINYFLFIFKHNINFIVQDKNFIENMKMQHFFVKKFKNLYYNYKYSYIYRNIILSIIYNMKKANSLRTNYILNCKIFSQNDNNSYNTSEKNKIDINEYVQIIKFFQHICVQKGKTKNYKNNAFYNYLKKNNIKILNNDDINDQSYEILYNTPIINKFSNYQITNIYINTMFFNYIIPMLIQTSEEKYLAVQIIFNSNENINSYMVSFNLMNSFLNNYNYDTILIKK